MRRGTTGRVVTVQYLLDTNILVHGVRRGETWEEVKRICDPMNVEPRPFTSVVTHGEIRAFAEQKRWGEERLTQMAFLLSSFERTDITDENILAAYSLLDTYSRDNGVRMGKNDLWIAATTRATGATLVTTDADFDHLHGKFLTRIYIQP